MTNKYQESINNLIEYANNRGLDRDCVDEIQSSIDDLQELVNKETAIKYKKEKHGKRVFPYCPNTKCNQMLKVPLLYGVNGIYCSRCGQHINMDDYKEEFQSEYQGN